MTNSVSQISGGSLVKNVLWNFLGQALPLLAAIVAIPILIGKLGTDRFGVLTLAWMVIGYFSLFDLGIGRALTKLVAEKLGAGQGAEISELIWTALGVMGGLGIAAVLLFATLAPWLAHEVLNVPAGLRTETIEAFLILALSIPVVISTAGLRGILEAHQRFDLINTIRIPVGLFSFLGPLLVVPFSNSLPTVVSILASGKAAEWIAYLIVCLRLVPALRNGVRVRWGLIRPLLKLGGWMTVTNVVGPLMVYLDRFLIGALVSMTAVAYYATPYEVVSRLWIIPGAVVGVLFPAFAGMLVGERDRAAQLFSRGVNYIFLALFPLIVTVVTFAHEGLAIWLGEEFAGKSATVLQWLAAGVLINSLAHVPFGLIQAAGRADVSAKVHLVELPFYLLALWWLLKHYGIEGAAIAWTIRILVDTVILFWVAGVLVPEVKKGTRLVLTMVLLASGVMTAAAFLAGVALKGLILAMVVTLFAVIAWKGVLSSEERGLMKQFLRIYPA